MRATVRGLHLALMQLWKSHSPNEAPPADTCFQMFIEIPLLRRSS